MCSACVCVGAWVCTRACICVCALVLMCVCYTDAIHVAPCLFRSVLSVGRSEPNVAQILCAYIWKCTQAKRICPTSPLGRFGVFQGSNIKKFGKASQNGWNDRNQIGHTYAETSRNAHRLNKLAQLAGNPLRGKSSVCMMCLKYTNT